MAEALTYDSLLSDVETYAAQHDPDFLATLPRLVMYAENRLASTVKGLGYVQIASATLLAGADTVAKPARWRETAFMRTYAAGREYFMKNRTYEFCRRFSEGAAAGTPRYFADYGYEHFYITPPPAADTNWEVGYFERPEPLDDAHQTNWTTQYAPQLLLYGTLLEAHTFLKNRTQLDTWRAMYGEAAAAVAGEAARRARDAAATREPR